MMKNVLTITFYGALYSDVEDDGDRCAKPSYICNDEPEHPECKDYLEEQQQESRTN